MQVRPIYELWSREPTCDLLICLNLRARVYLNSSHEALQGFLVQNLAAKLDLFDELKKICSEKLRLR
jgi:hypothetical protein